ncbi:MAG: 23S rRNA (pseudouridine(1915)-N(3))-methyltransferase RlmH [Muribaculaceae bacterium]|nr:23S rRNA (pseudouridine(1915)-N(3))-methyltransferase RlmH [Muribaculaceae bacterium]
MDIVLMTVGKTRIAFAAEGIKEYSRRLARYVPFVVSELPDVRSTRAMTEELQKEREGTMILDKISPADFVVLLDERGRQFSSVEFASYMEKLMGSGRKRMVFVIGGPYGFSEDVYARADAKLSLSRMTFNHEMVRMFFVEQIYRAMTILRGEPYHHE